MDIVRIEDMDVVVDRIKGRLVFLCDNCKRFRYAVKPFQTDEQLVFNLCRACRRLQGFN